MPYYRITVRIKGKGRASTGVRELNIHNVDEAWRYYKKKTEEKVLPTLIVEFEVVMLSKLSKDVQDYLRRAKRPPIDIIDG